MNAAEKATNQEKCPNIYKTLHSDYNTKYFCIAWFFPEFILIFIVFFPISDSCIEIRWMEKYSLETKLQYPHKCDLMSMILKYIYFISDDLVIFMLKCSFDKITLWHHKNVCIRVWLHRSSIFLLFLRCWLFKLSFYC